MICNCFSDGDLEWSEASELFVERSIRLAPGVEDDGDSEDKSSEEKDDYGEVKKENRVKATVLLGLNNTVSAEDSSN